MTRKPPPPFPFHILTGFLGAGKTTTLNQWLKSPALRDTLVMVNEFGDIALDHLFVETVADDIILLPSGCVCCAVRGDLVAALETILRKRDNDRIAPFARVILETTGLADPAPVLAAILNHPYLKLRFSVDSIVTVVDAVNGDTTLADHPVALQQAALADVLLVSKTDLALAAQLTGLVAKLRGMNPLAQVAHASQWPPEQLLDAGQGARPHGRTSVTAIPSVHGGITNFTLTSEAPVRAASFDLFLDLLRAQSGANLLRVKGLFALEDDPDRPLVIHAVQHILHPVTRLPGWPSDDHRSRLVFIVRDMSPAMVASLWDAFNGEGAATIG